MRLKQAHHTSRCHCLQSVVGSGREGGMGVGALQEERQKDGEMGKFKSHRASRRDRRGD